MTIGIADVMSFGLGTRNGLTIDFHGDAWIWASGRALEQIVVNQKIIPCLLDRDGLAGLAVGAIAQACTVPNDLFLGSSIPIRRVAVIGGFGARAQEHTTIPYFFHKNGGLLAIGQHGIAGVTRIQITYQLSGESLIAADLNHPGKVNRGLNVTAGVAVVTLTRLTAWDNLTV